MTTSPSRKGGELLARIARVVVPGRPHHISQRRNRRDLCFSAPRIIGFTVA
jgi:hypothetical protein